MNILRNKLARSCGIALSLVTLGLWTSSSFAVPVLDQSYEPGPLDIGARIGQIGTGGSSVYDTLQTFTVGANGTLDSVEVYVDRSGTPTENLIMSIVSGNTPTGLALASAIVTPGEVSATGGWVNFDLSLAGLAVTAGDFLGIRMSSLQNFSQNVNEYFQLGNTTGAYAGGAGAHISNGNVQNNGGWDFYFRTYVDGGQAVPEPGQLLIMGLGVFGLGLVRRRKTG